ncbi:MAG TPA: hypothetical protein VGL39_14800 [Jatrophihabitantaceae bacterium]
MSDVKRRIKLAMVAVADGAALLALRPDWTRLSHDLAAPHRWLDRVGADQAALTLATAALWCVALWLAIGLGAVVAAALPGRSGAAARRIATRLLPAVLLRAVAGVAGLGVLVAPIAPAVAGADVPPGAAAAAPGPAPAWPTNPPGLHIGWPTSSPPAPPQPAKPRPTTARPTPPPAGPSQPNPPGDQAGQAGQVGLAARGTDGPPEHAVRVEPGDSLWLIAAQRLGANPSEAQIAAAWPRWYAANKPVIGDDPSLIQPGQLLHAPPTSDATH